jgi:drug/metabolite transporter (DMT)-like permease
LSRLKADLLLLLAALIWGAAFVAQKTALTHIGSYTFIAARFSLSALLVLPFALRERPAQPFFTQPLMPELVLLCLAFSGAVMLQQVGIEGTSVTNAGFLTGLYVLFVPVICRIIFKQKISGWIIPAALLSVAGVWFLSGSTLQSLAAPNRGDMLVLLCAIGFAFQVTLIGRIMQKVRAPFRLSCLQYGVVALLAAIAAITLEQPHIKDIAAAMWPILYAGVLSGGVAYTVQAVAQQYTPASDSAVILSAKSVFAAIAGALLMGDRLTLQGGFGCGLIAAAILMVECGPYLWRRKDSE